MQRLQPFSVAGVVGVVEAWEVTESRRKLKMSLLVSVWVEVGDLPGWERWVSEPRRLEQWVVGVT
jgi:hypothetical protein